MYSALRTDNATVREMPSFDSHDAHDDWFESEASTHVGMIAELQRIRRRSVARPLPVLALGLLLAGAIVYKLATRKPQVEAEIVLALTEGSLATKHNGVPVDELRAYVANVLMPNDKLEAMIHRRGLDPLGRIDDAITELREQLDIRIWKNTFVYFDEDAAKAEHSARIGLTVTDRDPELAYERARDFADIIIDTAREQRQAVAEQLAAEVAELRGRVEEEMSTIAKQRSETILAMHAAQRAHDDAATQTLALELVELESQHKTAEAKARDIAHSDDSIADRIAAAGLDMQVQVVEENRPNQPEHRDFVLVMAAVIVCFGSLLGAALLVGAFDSRIYDGDDVARLGLPVLGHVPGFPGDDVGSLHARGATRARVPSFLRWRSHR